VSRRRSLYEWLGLSEQRWTKKPNEEVRPAKTAWDWLQLLIVPGVLIVIGYLFNAAEASRDREREDKRAAQAQFIAAEARRDQVLQDYLARMGDLVLDRGLRDSKQGSDVRGVGRTLTLTVLRRLDGRRKGEVVRFLADSKLIDGPGTPVLTLSAANLRGAVLTGASLRDVVFDAVDLRRAKFGGSALNLVRFEGARLERASFAGASLAGVEFTAARLDHASFRGTRMDTALTYGGTQQHVSFAGACLSGATFAGSDARRARFAGAEGRRVDFDNARVSVPALEGARIVGARLDHAHTQGLPAGWTKDGAPLTAAERRRLCTAAAAEP
jgi:uncharacterized protein YjbI with pentapeptide repeats